MSQQQVFQTSLVALSAFGVMLFNANRAEAFSIYRNPSQWEAAVAGSTIVDETFNDIPPIDIIFEDEVVRFQTGVEFVGTSNSPGFEKTPVGALTKLDAPLPWVGETAIALSAKSSPLDRVVGNFSLPDPSVAFAIEYFGGLGAIDLSGDFDGDGIEDSIDLPSSLLTDLDTSFLGIVADAPVSEFYLSNGDPLLPTDVPSILTRFVLFPKPN